MAAVVLGTSYSSGALAAASYTTASFTPVLNDLLVAFVNAKDTAAAGAMLDSQGLGPWKLVESQVYGTSHKHYLFVATVKAAASSMTVTFQCTGDNASSCSIDVLRVSGMARTGLAAIRQVKKAIDTGASPLSATFVVAALTSNACVGSVTCGASSSLAVTPPTSWVDDVEKEDTDIHVPGRVVSHRSSGETGTTISWTTSQSFSEVSVMIAELDVSTALSAGQIAFRAAGAGVATETSAAALSPVCPQTIADHEVLIAHVFWEGTTSAPSTPSGWTALSGPHVIESTIARHWVFGKVAEATDSGATVAFGNPAVTTQRAARIYAYEGRVSGSITLLVKGFSHQSHATDPQMPTVTTTQAGALAVALMAQNDNNTSADATGMTGGTWKESIAEFVAALTPGLQLQAQHCTPTANPGTVSGGSVATTNDPCGVIGFQILASPDPVTGTHATTLADDTSSASGSPVDNGTAAVTLEAFLGAAAGSPAVAGTAASTLDAFTCFGEGAYEPVTGDAAITLEAFTSTASGTSVVTGNAAITLEAFTNTASGTPVVTGQSTTSIADFVAGSPGTAAAPQDFTMDFDPNDASNTIVSGRYSVLKDLSANSYDLEQATVADQPEVVDIGGENAAGFTFDPGVDEFMAQEAGADWMDVVSATAFTLAARVRMTFNPTLDDTQPPSGIHGIIATSFGIFVLGTRMSGGSPEFVAGMYNDSYTGFSIGSGAVSLNVLYDVVARFSGTELSITVNGTKTPTAVSGTLPYFAWEAAPVNMGRNPSGGAYFEGDVRFARVYDYALSDQEVADLSSEWDGGGAASPNVGSPVVTGTAAADTSTTSASSGTPVITTSAAVALADTTSSGEGDVGPGEITGSAAVTLAADSVAAAGTLINSGSSAVNLEDAATAISGSGVVTSASAVILADVSASASGSSVVAGSSANTLADLGASANGSSDVVGTAAATTTTTTAASGNSVITSSAEPTLDAVVVLSNGTSVVTASSASTLDAVTSASDGTPVVTATSAVALATDAAAAAGAPVVNGSSVNTLADLLAAATGISTINGSSSPTLDNATTAAPGTPVITATSDIALAAVTVFADDAGGTSGTAAVTVDMSASAAGSPVAVGSSATAVENAVVAAIGAPLVTGAVTSSVSWAAAATGTPVITATATAETSTTTIGVGAPVVVATGSPGLSDASSAGAGGAVVAGAGSTALSDALAVSLGSSSVTGVAVLQLDAVLVAAEGEPTQPEPHAAIQLDPWTAAAAGTPVGSGVGAGSTFVAIVAAGHTTIVGQSDVTLDAVDLLAQGAARVVGEIAVTLVGVSVAVFGQSAPAPFNGGTATLNTLPLAPAGRASLTNPPPPPPTQVRAVVVAGSPAQPTVAVGNAYLSNVPPSAPTQVRAVAVVVNDPPQPPTGTAEET